MENINWGVEMLKENLMDNIEYLYKRRDYENLIERCDELLEIDNDNPIALNYKAIALYYLDNYNESLELLDYNLKLHPGNPYVLNNMALVYIALGKYQKALDCCEEGLKYKDNFDWLLINKIEALIHLGRKDEAHEFYKSVEIPYYTFEEALSNCGEIRGDGLTERLDELLSEEKFEEVIRICESQESSEKIFDYRIISLLYLKRFDEALQCADEAIESYPHNYTFHLFRAQICMICERLDDAIESYERAFEITGSVSNLRLEVNKYVRCLDVKAHHFIESGRYGDAIKTCEKIITYRPIENGVI
jgi:tetratricopeptide (TPR) repeat protein